MNLRIISAWRTLSRDAANVLSGVPPIRLLPLERNIIRAKARETLFKRWQEEWDSSKDGRWTHKLVPKIKEWILREHGSMEYHLTQGLSDDGCFGRYVAKRGHRPNSNCWLCGKEEDDGEYTIFACPVHEQDRRELTVLLTVTKLSLWESKDDRNFVS